jgi:hypothetical protein
MTEPIGSGVAQERSEIDLAMMRRIRGESRAG